MSLAARERLATRVLEGRLRTTVVLYGTLDMDTADTLRDALRDAVGRTPREIVIDCACLTSVEPRAAVVAPFAAAARTMRTRNGRVWIAGDSGVVHDALHRVRAGVVRHEGTNLVELVP